MKKTKNIWYVSKYVSTPKQGNLGTRGYAIFKELVELGNDCTIITSDSNNLVEQKNITENYNVEISEGIRIVWIKTLKYKVAKSFLRILSWLHFELKLFLLPIKKCNKPDIVIISSLPIFTIFNGLIFKWKYGCKLVFEIRDIWPLTLIEEGGFSPFNPLVRCIGLIEKLGYKYSDLIVGTMPNLKEHVQNILGQNKKVICVPMGLNQTNETSTNKVTEGLVYQLIPKDKFVVLHAGTIGITNALETFFECAELCQKETDIHFLIVGDGSLKQHFQQKYQKLKNLTFGPKLNSTDLKEIINSSSLLYFSTFKSQVWKYGQSLNKIVDYMKGGRPIIGSYEGFPTMINEANCGEFVPAEDPLELKNCILKYSKFSKNELQVLGNNGRDWLLKNRQYKDLAGNYYKSLLDLFD